EWDDSNLAGIHRFLNRIERFYLSDSGESLLKDDIAKHEDLKIVHKTIKKVTEDIESLSFNTAIAQMMIFLNHVAESNCKSTEVLKTFIILLSPFAPHLAEELWFKCIHKQNDMQNYSFVSLESWPNFDSNYVIDDNVTIGVQVNGKHRGEITIPRDSSQEVAVAEAYKCQSVNTALEQKTLLKTIYVSNRILNFVIK
ncbi:MAG: class I tRNA ligase family protein, partial [Silvanigrellaceae bacterium]|nr:class I tRNA ligase family protein [Silvanigrellaceae bacterium]